VVTPGTVRVDDPIEVVEADARTVGRRIADRLRRDDDDGGASGSPSGDANGS
jgi:MOSC domain-containing protein YiiM